MLKSLLVSLSNSFIRLITVNIVFLAIGFSTQAQTALKFNGTNSYVEIPHTATNNPAQFTVEFWVRVDGGAGTYRAPLSNRKSPVGLAGYNFYVNPDNKWEFSAGNGGGINVWEGLPGPAVVIGQWTHLAASHDGTTYRFYVDGILVNSLVATFSANTGKPLRIGAGLTESTTPNYYFLGAVDEVRIWNYARSASQINDNKNVNLSVPQTGLMSYYQFVNGSGTSKTGSTTGTLKNSPTTVNGVFPSAPTSISGTSSICAGNSTTLTSTGGSTGVNALDVWYAAANSEAFSEGWDTNGYAISGSTINNTDNGILNVTSTFEDPMIMMNNIGSFDPSVYKYINFRYRVASGTALNAQFYFLNTTNTAAIGANVGTANLVSDNAWHIATIDMSSNSNWKTGGNITGWRYDYAGQIGVTMDTDFITLSTNPIVGTGSSITVTPSVNTSYSVNRKWANDNTASVSQLVTVNSIPVITSFTPTSAGTGTTVTLTGTDFTGVTAVSFGGIAASSFTVVSATSITAVVASGSSGSVSVTNNNNCTATKAGFTYLSSNANLSSLSISSGVLSPAFASSTLAYTTADVNYATTSITVTPTKADVNAAITVNGTPVLSGSASSSITLNIGSNSITIVVTAQNGSTKTYTLTVTREMIPPGNTLNFNGVNHYVNLGDVIEGFTNITFEAWVFYDGSGSGSYPVITYKESVNSFAIRSDRRLYFHLGNGTNWFVGGGIGSNSTIPTSRWTHVAATWDGATVKLYINGVLDKTALHTGTVGTNASVRSIGGISNFSNSFLGKIDELRIYDSVLNQSAIAADMVSTSATSANLIGYYNFDSISGNVLIDKSTSNFNGSVINGPILVESYAMVVPTATAAASISTTGFTANWTLPSIGTIDNGYRLDVSTSSTFASFVSGYDGLNVGNVTAFAVTGLSPSSTYYYRVRADKTSVSGQGANSNIFSTATAAASSNADLSALSTTAGLLSPTFASGTLAYVTADVSYATTSITVTPTQSDANASITVNTATVNSGFASGLIALNTGSNTITVAVTAQDLSTIKTYTITVVRGSIINQTVTAEATIICSGTSTNINVASSQVGVNYTVRDNSNNAVIGTAAAGTGSALNIITGILSADKTFNVFAEKGASRSALAFTGNTGLKKVSLGNTLWTNEFAGKNKLTVEAWVYRTSLGSLQTIIGNYDNNNYPLLFRIDNDKINFMMNSGVGSTVTGATTLAINTWIHLTGTYDGSNLKVYVNGSLDGTTPYISTFASASYEVKIGGGLSQSGNTEYFPGSISDVRLWTVAKTQAEISANKDLMLDGNEVGLVANYKFNEGSGSTAANSATGNFYPGTLINSPARVAGPVYISSLQLTNTPTVTVNPLPTASISGTIAIKYGQINPGVSLTGANGTGPYTFTYNLNGGANTTVSTISGNSINIGSEQLVSGTYAYNLVSVQDASSANCIQGQLGTATITISKETQTITFGAFGVKTYGDIAFTLSSTAGASGNAISYQSSNTAVATVSGNTVTIQGAGSSIITASQAGKTNYLAASDVTQVLTINKATATIALSNLSTVYDGTSKSVTATTIPSGLNTVNITYAGLAAVPTTAGSYAVEATLSNANYVATAIGSLIVDKANPIITNFNNVAKKYFDASYIIAVPTSTSTGGFTYVSDTPAVAVISGTTVTIVGAGTATITASQNDDVSHYTGSVTSSLTVSSVSVLTKGGGISSTNLNYVNQYGQIGGDFGLSANGAVLTVKTPIPLQNSLRINSANSQYLSFTKLSSLNATGDFTFETWIKFNSIGAGVMDPIFGGGQGDFVSVYGANFAARINVNNPCGADRNFFVSSLLDTNSWHHIALVRSGSTITAFLDGVATGNTTDCSGTFMNSLSTVLIGKNTWRGGYLDAYISNMRYVVGTAVYTTNFTPPKSVLSAIDGTEFLLLANDVDFPLKDSSHNNIGVTGYGSPVLIMENGPF